VTDALAPRRRRSDAADSLMSTALTLGFSQDHGQRVSTTLGLGAAADV